MIIFYSCPQCRAKDEPVELAPQRRFENDHSFLHRAFSVVGKVHDKRKCSNRTLSISVPAPEQQKAIGA